MGCLFAKNKIDKDTNIVEVDKFETKSTIQNNEKLIEFINKNKNYFQTSSLFCDDKFPASINSVWYNPASKESELKAIEWKRPKDLSQEPVLFDNEEKSLHAIQANLGDCWFIAACNSIARNRKLLNKVYFILINQHIVKNLIFLILQKLIPQNQNLFGKNYYGIVYCCFYQFGEWVDIFCDDLLPTYQGKLFFSKSSDSNNYWISFLEKAYAKYV